MDRRTLFKALAGVTAFPVGITVSEVLESKEATTFQIIGMYAALSHDNRAIALQKLRDTGERELVELADAFERQL